MSRAAWSGPTTGLAWSWPRAVVANTAWQSAMAASRVSNSSALSRMSSAPEEARLACIFGQPSRGLTSRRRLRPKLPMARAAVPIFSPSCGSTSTTIGTGEVEPGLGVVGTRSGHVACSFRHHSGLSDAIGEAGWRPLGYCIPALSVRSSTNVCFHVSVGGAIGTRAGRGRAASWRACVELPVGSIPGWRFARREQSF